MSEGTNTQYGGHDQIRSGNCDTKPSGYQDGRGRPLRPVAGVSPDINGTMAHIVSLDMRVRTGPASVELGFSQARDSLIAGALC